MVGIFQAGGDMRISESALRCIIREELGKVWLDAAYYGPPESTVPDHDISDCGCDESDEVQDDDAV